MNFMMRSFRGVRCSVVGAMFVGEVPDSVAGHLKYTDAKSAEIAPRRIFVRYRIKGPEAIDPLWQHD